MIDIRDVTFRYPRAERAALDGLTLHVRDGSLFGLLGPNGSGKTTLISIIAGLLPVSPQAVRIGGRALADHVVEIQSATSLVPQEYAFYPSLTVTENLDFFAGVQRLPAGERSARIDGAVAIAGLEQASARRAEQLSGGLKRRLNLAIGLLNRPRLLLLDEPTVGIDPQSRAFILDAITRINRDGTTVVYTTHYMEEVEAICDEIGILDQGRLLAQGSLSALLASDRGGRLRIDLASPLTDAQQRAMADVTGLASGPTWVTIDRCEPTECYRVMALLQAQGVSVVRMQYGHGNLEELFLTLTKRQLRDA